MFARITTGQCTKTEKIESELQTVWLYTEMLEMVEEQDTTQCLRKVSRFFTEKRFKDSSWSWIVCVSSAVCNAVNFGMTLGFGVLFPVLMEYFDETRERTG